MNSLTKQFKKTLSITVLLCCLASFSTKLLAQGPNAPEAASFEPVDATDMVNLVTGDLSYVLPLLNVPSPEGGYPIALSYHAGIPQDLEASWVGLGWNLNSGTINRSVNGYPDDWGEAIVNHFFNDSGWTENYYDFAIGANIYGINVGVGAYWGSNKTFGGSVTFGVGPLSGTLEGGTRGIGVSGNLGPFSASLSSYGIGIGGSANTSYGGGSVSVNYNYKSGISGSSSVSLGISSIGISFNSQGNLSGSIGNYGGGVNNSSYSISSGDYATTINTKGINLDLVVFRIRAGRTQVKYSLYKEEFDRVTGILHPYKTPTYGDFSMDYVDNIAYDESMSPLVLINSKDQLQSNHLLYAGFDNYSLNAQGLSGEIQPKFIEEIDLYSKYKTNGSDNNRYYNLNLSQQDLNLDLNNKLFFYFKNHYSSFLRTNKSSITTPGSSIEDMYINAYTNDSGIYTSNLTPNGEILVNQTYGRIREGNYIQTFTNNDINIINSQNTTADYFIEAKGINRLNNEAFIDEGIGAFKVTAVDGKTYHYSLPVYNFELFYKNFNNASNEDEKFYLNTKDTPYATHWLLTAITGPDYVDINMDGELDAGDYGYWVEFEYGKWTDGYIWKGASGSYDTVKGDGFNDDSYEYYRGRKQIYYLDAIRTRTHTAFFVKSLRKDSKGDRWLYAKNNLAITSGTYNIFDYTKTFSSDNKSYSYNSSNEYEFPEQYDRGSGFSPRYVENVFFDGYRTQYFYADFPKHDVLRLDKIVLIKNDKIVENNIIMDKSAGIALNSNTKGYFYKNGGFKVDYTWIAVPSEGWGNVTPDAFAYHDQVFYKHNNFSLQEINIHQSENVLDINDLVGIDVDRNADKIITFSYDESYPLVNNSPNSDAVNKGKLTLSSVNFGGKKGVALLPSYKFDYSKPFISFDTEDEDAWGYNKYHSDAWSLNEIVTPIGAKIKIDYESDDFYREAIKSNRVLNNGLSFYITKNTNNELLFEITLNDHANAKDIEEFDSFLDYFQTNAYANLDLFICRRSKYGGAARAVELDLDKVFAQIVSVSSQSVTLKINDDNNFWTFDDQDRDWILNRIWSLTDVTFANGNSDGVIVRYPGLDNCSPWRTSYNNDDVNMNFQLVTSTVPYNKTEGGVRVKSIEITDDIKSYKTNYYYNEKGYDKLPTDNNYRSSGITSYSPSKEAKAIPYVAELPSPMVMYKNVTIENISENEVNGKTEYVFETLSPYQFDNNFIYSLGDNFKVKKDFETSQFNGGLITNKHTILNKLNYLGRLLSVKEYNSKNQIIRILENGYKNNLDSHGEIGVYEESYLSKSYNYSGVYNDPKYYFVTSASRVNYPSVLENSTESKGGFSIINTYNKYDFLTGKALEISSLNSKGNEIKKESFPAYQIDEYSDNITYYGMGSKVDNFSHKNMLIQDAMTKTYLKVGGVWKETSVGITTWNNQWDYINNNGDKTLNSAIPNSQKIWRKHKNFVWDGNLNSDGTLNGFTNSNPEDDDESFVWTVGQSVAQTNSEWKNISTTTLYDHYSMPLEVQDINGNYAATKTSDDDSKVLAVSNAKYTEIYYSSGEYLTSNASYFDGQVKSLGYLDVGEANAHTGTHIVRISGSQKAFEVTLPQDLTRTGLKSKFKISVWVKSGSETNAKIKVGNNALQNFQTSESIRAGGWVLLNGYIDIPTDATTVSIQTSSGSIDLDDFRLHPIASSMTGYVYNEWDELWYIIGNNGLASKYEYDKAGRLIKTYTEVADFNGSGTGGFKQVNENNYNYKKQL